MKTIKVYTCTSLRPTQTIITTSNIITATSISSTKTICKIFEPNRVNKFSSLKRTYFSPVEFFITKICTKYHNKIYVEQHPILRTQLLTSTVRNIQGDHKLSSLQSSQSYHCKTRGNVKDYIILNWHTIMPQHYSGFVSSLSHYCGRRYYSILKKCIIKLKRNIYYSSEFLIYELKYIL